MEGKSVAIVAQVSKEFLNELCDEIEAKTGQPADWGYVAGRAVIKTTGNEIIVKTFLKPFVGDYFMIVTW